MTNRVCEILDIKYPVIQGAMAWTSMAPLVAAVSNTGGLGVLGSGFMPTEVITEQIGVIRKLTDKPFAANMFLDRGEQLEVSCSAIIKEKVPVAYVDTLNLLEYNFAKEYYDKLHAAGCKVVAKINCLQDAEIAEKAGADVIIAKGVDGVEMGTAFVATHECPVHPNVKDAIVKARDIDIVACGYCTGEASWQIRNKLADRLLEIEACHPKAKAAEMVAEAAAGSLRIGALEGDVEEHGAVMSGQAAGLIHSIENVEKRIVDFCRETEEILSRKHTLGL